MDFIMKYKKFFIWSTIWIIISLLFGILPENEFNNVTVTRRIIGCLIIGGIFILPLMLLKWLINGISKDRKKQKEKIEKQKEADEQRKKAGISIEGKLKHTHGLPIPENSVCSVVSYTDKYVFSANGLSFNLLKSKITDICIKTDIEISKQVVSSIGGAIGGAILFGALGAIIGGRAKNKEIKTTTQYLIFTYVKDDDVKYIGFVMDDAIFIHTAYKIANEFTKEQTEVSSNIEVKQIDL